MLTKQEKEERLRKSEGKPHIQAQNAEVGKTYLTVGMLYKVKVLQIGEMGVYVDSETSDTKITISSSTELIEYDDSLYISPKGLNTNTNNNKERKNKNMGEKSEVTLASIIDPGLMAGKTPEQIADEIIEKIPSRLADRKGLIQRIRGPRKHYLIKKLQKEGKEVPVHLLSCKKSEKE
jgi:hypothetical protein